MKKNIIALLLVLAVVSFGVFADDPGDVSFNVITSIDAYANMKLTSEAYNATPATIAGFDGADEFEGDWDITEAPEAVFISAISNNRLGYTVKFDATAMVNSASSAADKINFIVTVGTGAGAPTFNTATEAVEVDTKTAITSGVLAGMKAISEPVDITVNPTDLAKATTGNYLGTVTFYFDSL